MSSTSAPFGFRPSYHNSGRITAKAYVIDGTRSGTVDGINLLGIFAGVQYDDSTGKPSLSPFWPASTAATNIVAFVYDDPEIIFDVQYDNPASGTTVQTAVGEECDWSVASPGGSTSVGLSETKLTAIQATSGQFQITGIAGGVDNALTDAYVEVTVRINEHQYKAAVNSV